MLVISLKSYDLNLLNQFCEKIKKGPVFGKIGGSDLRGPVFLPKKKKLYTVIRSPHVYSLSREQFEICIHRRAFIINDNFIKPGKLLNLKIDSESLALEWWDFYKMISPYVTKARRESINDLHLRKKIFFFWKRFLKVLPVGISVKFSYCDSSKFFGV